MFLTQSITLIILAALEVASARPARQYTSILTSSPSSLQNLDLPVGKTPISRNDMAELGRLAIAINSAYCPHENRLQPHPANSLQPQQNYRKKSIESGSGSRHATSIIVTSEEVKQGENEQDMNVRWYISHTPSTQTLTLAFASMNSVDDLLELLASSPTNNSTIDPHLVELPRDLFPSSFTTSLSHLSIPKMHHSFAQTAPQGLPALQALLDLIDSPPMSAMSRADILHSYIAVLTGSGKAPSPLTAKPIRHVEIVGHGLGSAIGLLVAAALQLEFTRPQSFTESFFSSPPPKLDISATLFGLPRIGNQEFANWIDDLTVQSENRFRLNRITSYADTIVHLPERHHKLAHPSKGEIWIGADPRVAFACRPSFAGMESEVCAESIPLAKTSLLDHSGPFGGVWIAPDSCSQI